MLDILQKILIGLFGCALIFFPIAYRMMDKIRFHGQMCIRQMDDDLLRWIEAAAPLICLNGPDDETAAEYARLTAAFRSTKSHRSAEKVRLVNELYELVRKAAIRSYGDARARAVCAELRTIYEDISMLAEDYNTNSKKLNAQLDGGVGGFFGKIFFIRPQPLLEDLTDLKS